MLPEPCFSVVAVHLEVKKLEAFEMWLWRSMERVSWRDQVKNEDVLKWQRRKEG